MIIVRIIQALMGKGMALFACEAKRRRENIKKERARDPNWLLVGVHTLR